MAGEKERRGLKKIKITQWRKALRAIRGMVAFLYGGLNTAQSPMSVWRLSYGHRAIEYRMA
jgi:hypothetical protein